MSDLQIEEVTDVTVDDVEAPPKQEYCHIDDGSDMRFYCGKLSEDGGPTCPPYNGEAICPGCGLATCPQCAVMSNLNERLENA